MRYNIRELNFPILLLSFTIACGLWYSITVSDTVEVQLEVRIDYKEIPEGLIITKGLIKKIDVRISGPEPLLRDPKAHTLVHVVDLSNIKKGDNILPLSSTTWDKAFRAFKVREVTPPRLEIHAEQIQERNVAIVPDIQTNIHSSAFKVTNVVLSPNNALISGAESIIKKIKNIALPIQIDPKTQPGTYAETIPLGVHLPEVLVTPSQVELSYTVVSERKQLEITRNIRIEVQEQQNYSITPKQLQFTVELPQALIKNTAYLAGAYMSVTPPPLEIGQKASVPLRLILPEGMTLTGKLPLEVEILRVK